jgi:ubiquinone biosynthesis protein
MPSTLEDARRVAEIVRVFARHGLAPVAIQAGLASAVPLLQRFKPGKLPADTPRAVRESFEELGAAFIKLGQMLSLRPDLIPHEYSDEFRKLLDEIPPEPFEDIRKVVEQEFRKPLRVLFREFDPKPVGSASVAQVHRARLPDGTRVVVKVQRPGVRDRFGVDIELLRFLAYKLEPRFAGREYSPTEVVREFERYTRNELSFSFEARAIERFRRNLQGSRTVVVPRVFWDRTTDRVLTMEEIPGVKLSEVIMRGQRIDRRTVIRRLVDLSITQLFEKDLFHADLHPGNILLMRDGRIGLLDFGIVGSLDESLRHAGLELFLAIVERDSERAARTMLKVGTATERTDIGLFRQDVRTVMAEWGFDGGRVRATHVLHLLLNQAVKHHIRVPPDIVLLAKALMTVEGSCRALDPDFSFLEYGLPRLDALLRKRRAPGAVAGRLLRRGSQVGEILADLPAEALEAFERLKTGRIRIDMRDTDMRHLGMDMNLSFNRLSYAMIAAAFIIGGAMVVQIGPKVAGYSVFTVASVIIAAMLCIVLLYSVWREGRALHKD